MSVWFTINAAAGWGFPDDGMFTVLCAVISGVLSFLGALAMYRHQEDRKRKRELYVRFYDGFMVLYDKIHQGRAFDFSDLDSENREKIVDFLQEHRLFADAHLRERIYELTVCRLDEFGHNDPENKETANRAYRDIVEYIAKKDAEKERYL